MSSFFDPACCANTERQVDGQPSPCQSRATEWCGRCRLVQYCSRKCQHEDWRQQHKQTCKSSLMGDIYIPSWVNENRTPDFVKLEGIPAKQSFGPGNYYWGNVPAIDVLKLKDNEGLDDMQRDLDLCFAASRDLRNVVKTVVELPEGHEGNCRIFINDVNPCHSARNTILLMKAMAFEPKDAVPMMIHLWYSAFIPKTMLDQIQAELLPRMPSEPEPAIQQFSGTRSILRVLLLQGALDAMKAMLAVGDDLTMDMARLLRLKITKSPERVDFIDMDLYRKKPALRTAIMKWRNDGVLLPFGASRKAFDTPNPTLFREGNGPGTMTWPMADDADPREGWARKDYAQPGNNDEYGSLFFYLRDILTEFCQRVRRGRFSFTIGNLHALELPRAFKTVEPVLQSPMLFDRVEISNICDLRWFGLSTLSLGQLLKPRSKNPHATLLFHFIDLMCDKVFSKMVHTEKVNDPLKILKNHSKRLEVVDHKACEKFAKMVTNRWSNPENLMLSMCAEMFQDFDTTFNDFVREERLVEKAAENGVKVKATQTIMAPWPYRITERSTKEEFKERLQTEVGGHERYLEFEQMDDPAEMEGPVEKEYSVVKEESVKKEEQVEGGEPAKEEELVEKKEPGEKE